MSRQNILMVAFMDTASMGHIHQRHHPCTNTRLNAEKDFESAITLETCLQKAESIVCPDSIGGMVILIGVPTGIASKGKVMTENGAEYPKPARHVRVSMCMESTCIDIR